ncbi:MAG: clostripain-related cysteine peptidase [Candidatus Babeliales bacterium]
MKRMRLLSRIIILLLYRESPLAGQEQLFDIIHDIPSELTKATAQNAIKPWTFIVYIAGANDLSYFASLNIEQMKRVGSTQNLNIVVQHMRPGNRNAYRCLIGKNTLLNVENLDNKVDSGSPKALIDCCRWAIENYPAQNYALILWNHGTGIIDPVFKKGVNPSELFSYNPTNNLMEFDRTVGFLDFMNALEQKEDLYEKNGKRGICVDERFRTYINNQQLDAALKIICEKYLAGKKFSIIAFDACLMAMLEVANIVKNYAHILTASQELELGAGWPYESVLAPLANNNLTPQAFATHIVEAYQANYDKITQDYTHSAVNLDLLNQLEENVHNVATLLLESLRNQKNDTIKNIIKMCRQKRLCTSFDGTNYIDLHHFYRNLLRNLDYFKYTNVQQGNETRDTLRTLLETGRQLIETISFTNKVGKNLHEARGLSIYFPSHRIDSSYHITTFAQSNNWINFVAQYLLL